MKNKTRKEYAESVQATLDWYVKCKRTKMFLMSVYISDAEIKREDKVSLIENHIASLSKDTMNALFTRYDDFSKLPDRLARSINLGLQNYDELFEFYETDNGARSRLYKMLDNFDCSTVEHSK
jgi:hypothetical protein